MSFELDEIDLCIHDKSKSFNAEILPFNCRWFYQAAFFPHKDLTSLREIARAIRNLICAGIVTEIDIDLARAMSCLGNARRLLASVLCSVCW